MQMSTYIYVYIYIYWCGPVHIHGQQNVQCIFKDSGSTVMGITCARTTLRTQINNRRSGNRRKQYPYQGINCLDLLKQKQETTTI